jgi:hypothetical protein
VQTLSSGDRRLVKWRMASRVHPTVGPKEESSHQGLIWYLAFRARTFLRIVRSCTLWETRSPSPEHRGPCRGC